MDQTTGINMSHFTDMSSYTTIYGSLLQNTFTFNSIVCKLHACTCVTFWAYHTLLAVTAYHRLDGTVGIYE